MVVTKHKQFNEDLSRIFRGLVGVFDKAECSVFLETKTGDPKSVEFSLLGSSNPKKKWFSDYLAGRQIGGWTVGSIATRTEREGFSFRTTVQVELKVKTTPHLAERLEAFGHSGQEKEPSYVIRR